MLAYSPALTISNNAPVIGPDPQQGSRLKTWDLSPAAVPQISDGVAKKSVTNNPYTLCQLEMNDQRDLFLLFRTDRDRWADRARTEARAVRLALAEGAAGSAAAAAASRRLVRIVQFIRAENSRAIDVLAAIDEHSVSLDEAEQFQDMANEIVAVNTEMYALLLVNTAALRAAMKQNR
jgi:hypothetical protein